MEINMTLKSRQLTSPNPNIILTTCLQSAPLVNASTVHSSLDSLTQESTPTTITCTLRVGKLKMPDQANTLDILSMMMQIQSHSMPSKSKMSKETTFNPSTLNTQLMESLTPESQLSLIHQTAEET